jgi:hypothetical protein
VVVSGVTALVALAQLAAAQPVMVLDHGSAARHPLHLAAAADEAVKSAVALGPSYVATVTESPGGALRAVTVEIHYAKPVAVRHEWIELDLPAGEARAIGRDGGLHDLPPVLHIDAWSPKYLEARAGDRATVLVGGDDLEGVSFERRPGRVHVVLELDDTVNHPFRYESRCRSSWRTQARAMDHSARWRAAGETALYHFWIGEVAPGPIPLIKQRTPQGARAAIAITDHADQSSPDTLRALLYGSSDPHAPRYGRGGFFGHHLRLTKSLFYDSAGAAPPQLDDPRVRELADEMVAHGSEVIPHSATPRADSREVTERALAYFQRFAARTWIDHQHETNCEAFTDRGWKRGDPYYIADLLDRYGYRYVWSASELAQPANTAALDLLLPDHPELRAPWLFAHGPDEPGAPRLLLWSSQWMYLDARRLYALYAPAALDRLESRRGLHIAHTYLESLHARGPLRDRGLLTRNPDGSIVTQDGFEQVLAELERRQQRGSLLVAPIGELLDHVVAMSHVEVRYREGGSAVVTNAGPHRVTGASFTAPGPVLVDGAPPAHARTDPDGYTFWIDELAPGCAITIETRTGFLMPLATSPQLAR